MFANTADRDTALPSPIEEACRAEAQRQRRELILIPSESICFPECARVLASDFGNIYAEGQPDLRLSRAPAELARDGELFHAWHGRLSDARFYRGCVEADRVELLAKDGIAEAFARLPGSPPATGIHVNVQALSGAPANLAVFAALLQPGDGLLGLDLSHGGHLTHGSPFNISGRQYRAASYGIDEQARGAARRLDYGRIRAQALRHRPKLIVGGSSAYPWDWDWKALRAIADECGALLLADIAHLAGMVVAGVLNNPLPHAHAVTFTTHKTLCGPRGAVILTTCAEHARKVDNAVFPGLQGGPHVNSIAAIGRLFEIVTRRHEAFAALQRRIVENAAALAGALVKEGFTLEYGGTGTHLLLLDLKAFSAHGGALDGETASRLLESAGIICNKNTLPGDLNAAHSTGLRFGTPWLTQRGVTPEQLRDLAATVRQLLASAHAFNVYAPSGEERCRARVPFEALEEARHRTRAIAEALPYPPRPSAGETWRTTLLPALVADRHGCLVRGAHARLALDRSATCDVLALAPGQTAHGFLLRPDGTVHADVSITWLETAPGPDGVPEERLAVFAGEAKAEEVFRWLQALSDGYALLDPHDLYLKVEGPFVVEPLNATQVDAKLRATLKALPKVAGLEEARPGMLAPEKVFFVGQRALRERFRGPARKAYAYRAPEGALKKTLFHAWHQAAGAKLVPFGGWEMPVEYPTGIFSEHAAVRSAAGLFDVSHMSVLEVAGPLALPFLEAVLANSAARLTDGEAQYSYLLLPDGTALDDLYVYRFGPERYVLVVNASNAAHDLDWLQAVNAGAVEIDLNHPGKRVPGPVQLRDLREAGEDSLIDLALQGPLAVELLAELARDEGQRQTLRASRLNDFFRLELAGLPVIAARTGYTGEEVGFEIFVHPRQGVKLWELLLARGQERGVRPCGLGARDSLRIEAGFPLFGHELEGPEKLSLTEADYGFVSRLHVPFYVGRETYIWRLSPRRKRILRLKGAGRRSVRAGQAILDEAGQPAGVVTSFAFANAAFDFHVLAAVRADFLPRPGAAVRAVRATPEQLGGELDPAKVVDLTVLPRFPTPEEKAGWLTKYAPAR